MGEALGWGALAASSLVAGCLLALGRDWSDRSVGVVMAFGAGALISAVSFDLAQEGIQIGGGLSVAIGLAGGAITYFALNRVVNRTGPGGSLALGALLDGIPEQAVLGIGLASGEGVSVGLLVAIFVSNVPEAVGATADLEEKFSRRRILLLWVGVAVVCLLATVAGFALADATGGHVRAAINGFAAGALLVMLVDQMVPEATRKSGQVAGLATVLGFAVAAGLSAT
jgi:zinc transporter, ZIP family